MKKISFLIILSAFLSCKEKTVEPQCSVDILDKNLFVKTKSISQKDLKDFLEKNNDKSFKINCNGN